MEPLEHRHLLAVVTVSNTSDIVNGNVTSIEDLILNDGFDGISLREAIIAANADTTVDQVNFAVEGTIDLTGGELLITRGLSINGPGANRLTIDARELSRVFNVNNGNEGTLIGVAIAGLTITGGHTGFDGGGILNRETLTVTACHITGNSAGEDGGGIGNFGFGTFSIVNSTISNNSASGANGGGGGVFNFNGTKAPTSTISNSTISNNTTITTGGGIYNFLGTVVVEFSTVTENEAPADKGSGIATLGDTNVAATRVRSSIVAGNVRSDVDIVVGNVQSFQSQGFNLIGSGTATAAFPDDPLHPMYMSDEVIGTDSPLLGPLADNDGPTPTHLPLADSPAVDTGDPVVASPPSFDQRGAPYIRIFDGDGNSTSVIDKGAVERAVFEVDTLEDEDDFDFSDGDFSLREAIRQASLVVAGMPTIAFAPSLTAGGSAAIELSLDRLAISSSMVIAGPGAGLLTIDAKQASHIFDVDDLDGETASDVKLSGLKLTGGHNLNGGGAVFSQERLTISDSVITGNTAKWGGAIYNAPYGLLTVQRTRISGNHAVEFIEGDLGSGGGLYNWGGRVDILDSTISGNDSVSHGGGIFNGSGGTINIIRSTLSDNTASQNGGGIHNGDGDIVIESSTISGNHAERGGAVHVVTPNNRNTTFSNSTISGNVAPLGGGGVNNENGRTNFLFCTITHNVSNDYAGSGVLSAPSPVNAPTSFYSCIIAQNFDPTAPLQAAPLDVAVNGPGNSLESLGYNIVGLGGDVVDETFNQDGDQIIGEEDPRLGPLADNGGPTLTHALLFGSPAIDAGDPLAIPGVGKVPSFDQRGRPLGRVREGDFLDSIAIDIGAFEAQAPVPELAGDYNLSGTVDAADFVVWRNSRGDQLFAYADADGNGNGKIDAGDYAVWRSNFGNSLPLDEVNSPSAVSPDVAEPIRASNPSDRSSTASAAVSFVSIVAGQDQPRSNLRPTTSARAIAAARHDAALLAWVASRDTTFARVIDANELHGERARRYPITASDSLAASAFDEAVGQLMDGVKDTLSP